ncbi:hypothetical protein [Pedococcus bigeumensis]|uniref:Uncharacterized protein n=1 Tax=Pedococcus bigeumensis TaxID=433644 RepID=A0A502CSZ3_9MICO|nr:hypothetical protein [Pedococcus bigeumensis]TPG14926.1 hypothetical protein EAH86_15400 [Pedococcus bigeumensis]
MTVTTPSRGSWRAAHRRLLRSTAILVHVATMVAVAALNRSVAWWVLGVGVAVLVLVPVGLSLVERTRGTAAVRMVPDGHRMSIEFPARPLAAALGLAALVAGVPGLAALAAVAVHEARDGQPGYWPVAVVLVGVVATTIWQGARPGRGPRGWPAVRLTQEGVVLPTLMGGDVIAWTQEPRAVAWDGNIRVLTPSEAWRIRSSLRERAAQAVRFNPRIISAFTTGADVAVVAAAVNFYSATPERRIELTSIMALERIRRRDLPPPW